MFMSQEPCANLGQPSTTRNVDTGEVVRVVKLFDESLMWYQASLHATLSTCDLDNGWAVLQLGYSKFVLLSACRANEEIPAGTAICVVAEDIDDLTVWAHSKGLRSGTVGSGPWGSKALWVTDPEDNILMFFENFR